MLEDHIIYDRRPLSSFILDERRTRYFTFFPPEKNSHERYLLQNIFKEKIQSGNDSIIDLNIIFNQKKLNELFDFEFDNQDNPITQNFFRRIADVSEETWKSFADNRRATTCKLAPQEIENLKRNYVRRLHQIAEKIIDVAKQLGATDEIDLNLLIKIIQLHQQRRENPRMDFFVSLATSGNQVLADHLDALSSYSPFTSEQLQNVFHAAASQRVAHNTKRIFGDNDRLYYRVMTHGHNPTKEKVSEELEKRGFKILSYEDGTATKINDENKKQIFKIGRILKDNQTLLEEFRDDPTRQVGQLLIVLSRTPDDIAKMSTDRAWTSCMASTGMMGINNFNYVPDEIREGALIAYVVKASDPNIYDPLSRILLKPYKRVHGTIDFNSASKISGTDIIYIPGKIYGLPNQAFEDAITELCRELNLGMRDGTYKMAESCYDDGMGTKATVSNGQVEIKNPNTFLNQIQPNFMNFQMTPRHAA